MLDQDSAKDDGVGPGAVFGAQTCIHRLNALSKTVQTWKRANKVALENPVKPGVRPGKPDSPHRRVLPDEEQFVLEARQRSSAPWLWVAVIISIETAMRRAELAGLHGRGSSWTAASST